MKNFLLLVCLSFFSIVHYSAFAQINIKVTVKSIAVSTSLDCDAGGADNSDFVFEYKAQDNSPAANINNLPVAGSIGMCNYAVVSDQNGPYSLSPAAPGVAIFSPSNGVFFDRSYNCKNDIPTVLTITWRAYENDDVSVPSVTPIASAVIPVQTTTYTVPSTNGTFTTQYTQISSDGTCPQTYVMEFEVQKTVGSFSPLVIGTLEGNVICSGTSTGVLESSSIGGSGAILVDWSFDGLGDYNDNYTEANVGVGTYTVVLKDALNCMDTGVVVITEIDPPLNLNLFSSSSSTVCEGQTGVAYSVATQSNVVFFWNYTGGLAAISGTGNSITIDYGNSVSTGTLSVYAQNSCSTSPVLSMTVDVKAKPNIVVTGSSSMCDNVQEVLTASGASTYTWSTGANSSSISITPTSTTIYSVIASAINGCVAMKEYTMNVLTSPTVQISGSTVAVCPNQTVAVSASGNGNLFIWSDGFIGTNHTIHAPSTTIFTVTNTFTNSCFTQVTYTLNINPAPALSITGNTIVCEGGTVSLTANGANSYTWSDGATTTTNSFVPLASTSLTLVGTALNGCKDSLVKIISVVQTPTVTITGGDTICEGKFVNLVASANGTVTYGWNNGANTSTISVSPLGTFTYVVIADNGGCTGFATQEVYVKLIPTVDFTLASPLLCSSDAMVTFTANPSGGMYTGTGVTMGDMFDPAIGVGTYTIDYAVTVSNGCLASATQTIDVQLCTGMANTINNTNLNLFPNPTASDVTIISDKEIASILIYDFTGKLVRMIEANTFETKIDMTTLAKGFYTFTVTMSDKTQSTMKVVKE